jgi:hypothetical protein
VYYGLYLRVGEIFNPNGVITNNQAIDKLREAKELLELEGISQIEYNKLKVRLTPIITND